MSYFTRLPVMPLSNVAPFSERDAVTYAQMLADLRSAVVRLADAQVDLDGKMDDRLAQWNASLDTLETEIDAAIELVVTAGDQYLPEMNSLYNQLKTLADEIEPLLATSQRLDDEISDRVAMGVATNGRVDTLTSTVSVINGELESVYGMTPAAFGAVGDGNADDTSALEDWANNGGSTLEPGRVYRTSRPVKMLGDGRSLHGNGAAIVYRGDDSLEAHAVWVIGDHATVRNLTVTGNGGGIATGIWVSGSFAHITGNRVSKIHDVAGSQGIHVEGAVGGHLISNNTIYDILASGDGVIASGSGLARGIMFYNGAGVGHMQYESQITGNRISMIMGEEGNHIGVLAPPVGDISDGHAKSKLTISGNALDDSSRRGIKVQASEVTIKGNVIRDSVLGNAQNPSAIIDVINSKSVTVDGNTIYGGDLGSVSFSGPSTTMRDALITNNYIERPIVTELGGSDTCIYLNNAFYFTVKNNVTVGGDRAIAIGGSTAGEVEGNSINRLKLSGSNTRAVAIIPGNDRVNMWNNTYNRLNSGGVVNPFQNDSDNGVSANNNWSYA